MGVSYNDVLKNEYQQLFDSCIINASKYNAIDNCVQAIVAGKQQYESVSSKTDIPWYFIAVIHNLECSCNFNTHLHNGDPLTARTTHVPANYPKNGKPPFTWADSAEDALRLRRLDKWTDWSIPGMLFQLEGYNGFGYRRFGINSPYLWSCSNHYSKGKFTQDGIYDGNAISKQVGAAVLLRRLSEQQIALAGDKDLISQIKQLGEEVPFDGNNYNSKAEALQKLLNNVGQHLRVDGKAGRNTSDAYQRVTGKYLMGDNP